MTSDGVWTPLAYVADRPALCNYASTAGYYYWAGDSRSSTWIVYLEGGDWSWDERSFTIRERYFPPQFTGRALFPSSKPNPGGLFNSTAVPLRDAHKVFVPYCSSDAWMGDKVVYFGSIRPIQFRGASIVRSVIADLSSRHGLGSHRGLSSSNATDLLLFGGGSAGARGAMVHLDKVREYLPAEARTRVDVVGFLDSNYWVDVPPLGESAHYPSLMDETRAFATTTEAAALDAACSAAYQGSESWKCLFGQYRMPFVKTPYFMVASQNDRFQLSRALAKSTTQFVEYLEAPVPPAWSSSQDALIGRMAAATREGLQGLQAGVQQSAVFSWACFTHDDGNTAAGFVEGRAAGSTMEGALLSFLSNRSTVAWVDSCTGFDCGPACGATTPWDSHSRRGDGGGGLSAGAGALIAGGTLALLVGGGFLLHKLTGRKAMGNRDLTGKLVQPGAASNGAV